MGKEPIYITTDPFFDTYLEALQTLYDLGIEFTFKQRIPIFRVYTHLSTMEETIEVRYAMDLLDTMKEYMACGMEPEHNGDSYL